MSTQKLTKALKAILGIYVIFCLVIAGLNRGYVSHATPQVAEFINWFWNFYENWIKTLSIIAGSYLTLRIIGKPKRTVMRKRNLIGFIITALVVHIVTPVILNNDEIYFLTMPLPWTTTPIQLLYEGSRFYQNHFPVWGAAGISAALILYVCFSILVIVGTLLFGRRWQCSTLCLFNGFAAEVFAPVIPLIGQKKEIRPSLLKALIIFRWTFLGLALFFTIWWILFLAGVSVPGNHLTISKVEMYKYLIIELLMAMFFWVAFIGRGYCYFCPLGTVLGLFSKLAGQKITTDNTRCVQCGQCNKACPMTIDLKSRAVEGQAVEDLRCVGCAHCVDACPTETLSYTTKFLSRYRTKSKAAYGKINKSVHTQ
jgi:ferredoxin-type protein NapH